MWIRLLRMTRKPRDTRFTTFIDCGHHLRTGIRRHIGARISHSSIESMAFAGMENATGRKSLFLAQNVAGIPNTLEGFFVYLTSCHDMK
jgi:hypothetical protein